MKKLGIVLISILLLFHSLLSPMASTSKDVSVNEEQFIQNNVSIDDVPSETNNDQENTDLENQTLDTNVAKIQADEEVREELKQNESSQEDIKADNTKIEKETSKKDKILQSKTNKLVSKSIAVNATSQETVRRLLIDPAVIAENMTITTASGLKPIKKTIQQQPNGGIGGSLNDYKTKSYENFKGTGSQVLVYDNLKTWTPGDKLKYNNIEEVITVTYDHVGYIDVGDGINPKYIPVGAKMIISNIILGAGPRWTQMGVAIDFSNNFYSGLLYQYIQVMDIEFAFFEKGNPDKIFTFDGTNGVLSFLSLNGYGYNSYDEWGLSSLHYPESSNWGQVQERRLYDTTYEFVGSLEGVGGLLSENTKLTYHPTGTKSSSNNSYYMDGYPQFDDYLGGKTFLDSGVTFPLYDETHKFKLGSTYGYTWNSFMSASVQPVEHLNPVKTVQTLQNIDGNESNNNNRYDNDYDRLWELGEVYWKDGHNPNDLDGKLTEIENRYQKTGEGFYYFINQNAISIQTESLVLPKRIKIVDTLPEGVTLFSNSIQDLTLYNLDGSLIQLTRDEWVYDNNTRKLVVYLSETNTEKINNLSIEKIQSNPNRQIGEDFSLRIKVKVEKEAIDNPANNVMINEAKTTFEYKNISHEKNSNKVETAVRKLAVEKVWEDNEDKNNLRPNEVKVTLQHNEDGQWKDVGNGKLTLNQGNGWKGNFNSDIVGSGKYRVVEEQVGNYKTEYVNCSNHSVNETECGNEMNKWVIVNTLILADLSINKISSNGKELEGAEFTLFKDDVALKTEVSNNNGIVTFTGLPVGSYYIKETKAPNGYKLDDTKYYFEVVQVNNELAIDGDNWTKDKKIINIIKPFDVELTKKDNEGNSLQGVKFKIIGENGQEQESTTDDNGKVKFTNLQPGEYTIKETVGIPGYELSNKEIKVSINENGEVQLTKDIDFKVDFTDMEKNNLITITTPFINTKKEYSLTVIKVDNKLDEDGKQIPLKGAEFILFNNSGEEVGRGITNEEGKIKFDKLFIGNYQLKEVKSPKGHRLLTKPIDIEIKAENQETEITVENSKVGWFLPKSGGIGESIFYVLGVLIMLLVVILQMRKRQIG